MSALTATSNLSPFQAVLPAELASHHGGPTKSELIAQRRRVRITPQTGMNVGTAGAGGGNQQIQFLMADSGLIDPRSAVLNFTVFQNSAAYVPDDGHPFSTVQVALNGQSLDSITNAAKLTNMEVKMGTSRSWYQSAGGFAGFALLDDGLTHAVPPGTYSVATQPRWGYVAGNVADLAARVTRAASAMTGGVAGIQYSIPLGLISGVFRTKQYLPLGLLGEIGLTLQTLSAGEYLMTIPSQTLTAGDYSLSNLSIEFDSLVPHPSYSVMLQNALTGEKGITIPFESSVVASGGAIAASASLKDSTIVVSRSTNHLLRSSVVQVPSTAIGAYGCNDQSCFSHAGTWSVRWQIGAQTFPQTACQGDAALFMMSQAAYGAPALEAGSVVNRALWCNSTDPSTVGTPAICAGDSIAGTSVKFAYGDSFIPTYGFRNIKGSAEPLDVDGVSISGASGSQVQVVLNSAPVIAYTPYVSLVALRFIQAKAGAVTVQ